eukprot:TRINITY_DN10524_c0_g2_i1.p1 TRINITY_DN10524_c0_g2~~TRINITY_DN10524_c0_g2_i1.p1  ORF type:complete len:275 (-),score=48.81 TRINITY_DN10524_c0_g2_i1:39-863(-)
MPAKSKSKPAAKKAPAKGSKDKTSHVKSGEKKVAKRLFSNLIHPRPRDFSIGQAVHPGRNLTRFVKWPKYVKRQRQKRVLLRRFKVPPAVNQFNRTLDNVTKKELFKFCGKYKPESKKQRKARLQADAASKVKDKKVQPKQRKPELKCGLNRVTRLVETKRAKLVLIANDVDPLDIIIWLPALCKKLEVPYCIVKNKAALGRLCGFKTTSCCSFLNIRSEDNNQFNKLTEAVKLSFNDRFEEANRHWGGLVPGKAAQAKARRAKAAAMVGKVKK